MLEGMIEGKMINNIIDNPTNICVYLFKHKLFKLKDFIMYTFIR